MKPIIISVLLAVILIGAAMFWPKGQSGSSNTDSGSLQVEETGNLTSNVKEENGKQIITIDVRGGYNPRKTVAKAGIPTILRMRTTGSLDCASAVVIPDLRYQNYLPMTGETDIEVPSQSPGKILNGMCAMGMYRFQVSFK